MVPDMGLIKESPMLAFPFEVVKDVLTLPVFSVFATFVSLTGVLDGSWYNFSTASSAFAISSNSSSYFSIIEIFSRLMLFFSFNPSITFSASSKLDT